MKIKSSILSGVVAVFALVALSGCAGMTQRERNTATGAVVGGAVGVIVGGGVLGTAAGAAAGGVIGHQMSR